jgi:hypothetical protein
MGTKGEVDDPFGSAIAAAFSALSESSTVQEALGGVASALGSVGQRDDDQSASPPEDDVLTTDAIEEEACRHAMVAQKQANLKKNAQARKKIKIKPK